MKTKYPPGRNSLEDIYQIEVTLLIRFLVLLSTNLQASETVSANEEERDKAPADITQSKEPSVSSLVLFRIRPDNPSPPLH